VDAVQLRGAVFQLLESLCCEQAVNRMPRSSKAKFSCDKCALLSAATTLKQQHKETKRDGVTGAIRCFMYTTIKRLAQESGALDTPT
jgi:hypothetical protein